MHINYAINTLILVQGEVYLGAKSTNKKRHLDIQVIS